MQSPADSFRNFGIVQDVVVKNAVDIQHNALVSSSNVNALNALITVARSASNDSAFVTNLRVALSNMTPLSS